jgi:hypothetical protein
MRKNDERQPGRWTARGQSQEGGYLQSIGGRVGYASDLHQLFDTVVHLADGPGVGPVHVDQLVFESMCGPINPHHELHQVGGRGGELDALALERLQNRGPAVAQGLIEKDVFGGLFDPDTADHPVSARVFDWLAEVGPF